jgi:hypothetical protein
MWGAGLLTMKNTFILEDVGRWPVDDEKISSHGLSQ